MTINNLVVLGNGFDLAAKIPTSFDKYLLKRLASVNLPCLVSSIYSFRRYLLAKSEALEILIHSDLTFWEFFLIISHKPNWSDMENMIREYILRPEIGGLSVMEQHFQLLQETDYNQSEINSSADAYLQYLRHHQKSAPCTLREHITYLYHQLIDTEVIFLII